jgi:hypothetical protein
MRHTEKRRRLKDAGIIEQNVDTTETLNSSPYDALNCLRIADVTGYVKYVFSRRIQAKRCLSEHILPPAVEHYFGSRFIEATRSVCANACTATSDDNYFIF